MIDRVTVRGGVGAAAGRWGTALIFDLQPGVAQRLGKVIIHWARDGHRVGGSRFRLLVILPETAAEMLLDDRVADCVSVDSPVVSEVWAAIVGDRTVRHVTVSVVCWGACDHRGAILLAFHGTDCVWHCGQSAAACWVHHAVLGEGQRLVHAG